MQNLIKDYAPAYNEIEYKKGEFLLVINPPDIHIGKYAAEKETGDPYLGELGMLKTKYKKRRDAEKAGAVSVRAAKGGEVKKYMGGVQDRPPAALNDPDHT